MLSKRIYFTIFTLMTTMFIMFMLVLPVSKSYKSINVIEENIKYKDAVTEVFLNVDNLKEEEVNDKLKGKPLVAIINTGKGNTTRVLKEYCIYNKYLYKVFDYFPSKDFIKDYSLILFGDMNFNENSHYLYDYSELGITMMFTSVEKDDIINNKSLMNFFGIEKLIDENIEAKSIKIFRDFLISNERIYTDGDIYGREDDLKIYLPYYSLRPATEVYSVALLDDESGYEKELYLPPLLWRAKTNNSFIFVVNHEIFRKSSLLGILTAFKTREKSFHIYPVVNGHTISVLNFPYLSNENDDFINDTYARDSKALSKDILWPSIAQILYNYGSFSSFFLSAQLNYEENLKEIDTDLNFYLDQIDGINGSLALSFSQSSQASLKDIIRINKDFVKKNLKDYKMKSIYLGGFNYRDFIENKDLLKDFSIIFSDTNEEENIISLIDNTLALQYNGDGFIHETIDDLTMISIENALGMYNSKVDIGDVFYKNKSNLQWNNLSLEWSRGKTYYNDFKAFDFVSIEELEKRVRRFMQLDFQYEYKDKSMQLNIQNFDTEAYFIFSIYDNEIVEIINGEFKEITQDVYLIKALKENVTIKLEEKSYIKLPSSNKVISVKNK